MNTPKQPLCLIASDVDGTLMQDGRQQLSADVFAAIRACVGQGVVFVAASGRQYPNLRRLFAPVWQDIIFVAENGALTLYKDEVLRRKEIDRAQGLALMAHIESVPGCQVLLSGVHTSYILPNEDYLGEIALTYRNTVTVVEDFALVDEPFLKISARVQSGNVEKKSVFFREKWGTDFTVMIAGGEWVDFGHGGKEGALQFLLNSRGILPQQCAVFGDNENDMGMLALCPNAYAMHGAAPAVQAVAAHTTANVPASILALLANKIP